MKFIIIGGGCYGIYHGGQLYKAILKGKLPPDSRLIIVDRNRQPPARLEHGDKSNFEFVQSDWQAYLQAYFSSGGPYDPALDGDEVQIVPAPFAPHLYFDFLQFSIRARLQELGRSEIVLEREGFDYRLSLPYEYTDPSNGNHFISRAGWTCPFSCTEPRTCPIVKGPRDWDLDVDLREFIAGGRVMPSASAVTRLETELLPNGQSMAIALADKPTPGRYSLVETFTCHHFTHGIGTIPARRLFEARARLLDLALQLNADWTEARAAIATISHCHGVVATLALKIAAL